ncbi:hypothetical protein GOV11_03145, partial [Candidatus Woesearchaeota archaeon]|nr:hypothetical protein [Candidatus Woesearchaeota archaeon]
VKFSGNKGWHIGIPFEAFPPVMLSAEGEDIPTSSLFPELPRAIAGYLVEYIGNTENGLVKMDQDKVTFGGKIKSSLSDLAKKVGKSKDDLIGRYDPKTGKFISKTEGFYQLMCGSCGHHGKRYAQDEKEKVEEKDHACPKCGTYMDWHSLSRGDVETKDIQYRFRVDQVVEIDTILLASRHLYRMPYSLHEKSVLASVVIDPDDILTFKKEDADPNSVEFSRMFLDPETSAGDADTLARKAWEYSLREQPQQRPRGEFEEVGEAIPEDKFPPCIKGILAGLPDGRKRSMFALTNFLKVCGWTDAMIDDKLHEWNEKNPEKLREVVLTGHMKQVRKRKERVPPPNCRAFYQEIGICKPDQTCATIKNPAQYSVKLVKIGKKRKSKA